MEFAKDKWIGLDKLFHLIRDAIIFYILHLFFINIFAVFLTLSFSILWEIKDGLISYTLFVIPLIKLTHWLPYSVSNFIVLHLNPGGDGFSFRDISAGIVGVVILLIIFSFI
jgi:hypothetical protein